MRAIMRPRQQPRLCRQPSPTAPHAAQSVVDRQATKDARANHAPARSESNARKSVARSYDRRNVSALRTTPAPRAVSPRIGGPCDWRGCRASRFRPYVSDMPDRPCVGAACPNGCPVGNGIAIAYVLRDLLVRRALDARISDIRADAEKNARSIPVAVPSGARDSACGADAPD